MPIQTKHGWKCYYCDREYPTVYAAEDCLETHKIVYVPLAKADINNLLMYIFNPTSHIDISKALDVLQRMLTIFNEKEKSKELSDMRKGTKTG